MRNLGERKLERARERVEHDLRFIVRMCRRGDAAF